MNIGKIDLLIILLYMAAMAAMGLYFSKKNKTTEEYFVGGRSFKGWVIGLSLVGTSISSITFLSFPADAFKTTWVRFAPNIALILVVFIASRVILPFFRRGKVTSAYEYLENRFGPSIRLYGCLTFIIGQLVRVSIILYLVSILMHQMTGLDPTLCIIVSGLFVAFYTIVGGIDAVIWTDVIQTVVLVLGGVLCLIVILCKLPGGLEQVISVAAADCKFAFAPVENGIIQPTSWNLTFAEKTASMMFLLGIVTYLTEYTGNQMIVQRYCASSSAKEARKAMWICAFSSLPIWAFYMFVGTALYVFFKVFPAPEATEMLAGIRSPEQIMPFFVMNYLPIGIKGVVIAAAIAAAMSSLDSSINSISTVGVVDIYKKYFAKGRNDKHYLKIAWVIAGVAGVAMIFGAVVLSKTESKTLQDTASILTSILGGGLLSIYLLGFLTKRGDARSVGMGIISTMIFTTWTIFSKRGWLPQGLQVPFDIYYTLLIGNMVMFFVGFFASYLFKEKRKDLINLTVWTQDKTPLD